MPKTKITDSNVSGPNAPFTAGAIKFGQTTVATAGTSVQITTNTHAPHGIKLRVKDSSTYYISSTHEGVSAGDDLSGRGFVVKANNDLDLPIDDPSCLCVDCISNSKTISWCIY